MHYTRLEILIRTFVLSCNVRHPSFNLIACSVVTCSVFFRGSRGGMRKAQIDEPLVSRQSVESERRGDPRTRGRSSRMSDTVTFCRAELEVSERQDMHVHLRLATQMMLLIRIILATASKRCSQAEATFKSCDRKCARRSWCTSEARQPEVAWTLRWPVLCLQTALRLRYVSRPLS